jgi:acetyl-CoA carboxylase carboxyltransferase component
LSASDAPKAPARTIGWFAWMPMTSPFEADADAREKLEERFRAFGSPFEAAKVFNFDELIDPRDTRPRIVRALRRARARRAQATGPWTYHGIVP